MSAENFDDARSGDRVDLTHLYPSLSISYRKNYKVYSGNNTRLAVVNAIYYTFRSIMHP